MSELSEPEVARIYDKLYKLKRIKISRYNSNIMPCGTKKKTGATGLEGMKVDETRIQNPKVTPMGASPRTHV